MKLDRARYAKIIALLNDASEALQQLGELLLPDEVGACAHPRDAIEHEETLDDEPTPYRCTLCGHTQDIPFHED